MCEQASCTEGQGFFEELSNEVQQLEIGDSNDKEFRDALKNRIPNFVKEKRDELQERLRKDSKDKHTRVFLNGIQAYLDNLHNYTYM